jgi:hypothetical protein
MEWKLTRGATFHSEDIMHSASEHSSNSRSYVSVRRQLKQHAKSKKTLKLRGWVPSLFQVYSSLISNCGIRAQWAF